MNNMSSYYGLVNAKIRASDKDLPVTRNKRRFKIGSSKVGSDSMVEFFSKDLKLNHNL